MYLAREARLLAHDEVAAVLFVAVLEHQLPPVVVGGARVALEDVKPNGVGVVATMPRVLARVRLRQLDDEFCFRARDFEKPLVVVAPRDEVCAAAWSEKESVICVREGCWRCHWLFTSEGALFCVSDVEEKCPTVPVVPLFL